MLESEKLKRMQNRKCYAYIIAGVVFQTIIILIFSLTVMRIKTPKVRVRSVTVQNLQYSASGTPSFNMTLIAEIGVRNKNFGHFRFDNTTANVTYGNVMVGDGNIIKARANARKTKRFNVTIEVSSNGVVLDNGRLSSELNSGNLTLHSLTRVRGKVTVMKVIKKRKTANMNCTMIVNLANQVVHDLNCE